MAETCSLGDRKSPAKLAEVATDAYGNERNMVLLDESGVGTGEASCGF
jgi:hypothetical protein